MFGYLLLGLFAGGQTALITLDTGIDWRVMAFAVGTSLMTGLACGLLPALRGTRVPVSESLKLQSRAVGLHSRRTLFVGRALVAAQMAFCLLLLIASTRRLLTNNPARFSLAYLAARSLGTVLYGIGPVDPVAYGTGAALLLSVGLVAAYLPAFRASRIEPMRAIAGG